MHLDKFASLSRSKKLNPKNAHKCETPNCMFSNYFCTTEVFRASFWKSNQWEKGKVEKSSKIMKDSSLWPLDQVQKVPKFFEAILMNFKVLGI